MARRWIVISLDGLANLALGPYGSSWNATPAIDQLAAGGLIWDRALVPDDDPLAVLHRCWTAEVAGQTWVQGWRQQGRVELISLRDLTRQADADRLAELASGAGFDACTLVDWQPAEQPAEEVEATAFAQLAMALLERLQEAAVDPGAAWSVLWLHSDFLTQHWDAPHWLFPLQELDDDDEPIDPSDPQHWDQADQEDAPAAHAAAAPPPLQPGTQPPAYRIAADAHPDWATSWMQTYGCQVRLVDHVLQWILELAGQLDEDIGVALLGTSGMSLGQDGWVGHRVGPVRSCQIHVPAIVHHRALTPLRLPQLAALPEVMQPLAPAAPPLSGEVWAEPVEASCRSGAAEASQNVPQVLTRSDRALRVVTTPRWFLVRQTPQQVCLFLKPDDRDDVNDVASLCQDVVAQLG